MVRYRPFEKLTLYKLKLNHWPYSAGWIAHSRWKGWFHLVACWRPQCMCGDTHWAHLTKGSVDILMRRGDGQSSNKLEFLMDTGKSIEKSFYGTGR